MVQDEVYNPKLVTEEYIEVNGSSYPARGIPQRRVPPERMGEGGKQSKSNHDPAPKPSEEEAASVTREAKRDREDVDSNRTPTP